MKNSFEGFLFALTSVPIVSMIVMLTMYIFYKLKIVVRVSFEALKQMLAYIQKLIELLGFRFINDTLQRLLVFETRMAISITSNADKGVTEAARRTILTIRQMFLS